MKIIKRLEKLIIFTPRIEMLIFILMFLSLLPLYFFRLSSIPTSVHGDEGETALQAINIINGTTGLIGVGWFNLPLLSFLPHGIFMFLFGTNIVSDRLGSVIFGILALPFFYFFVKKFFDKNLALVSFFLLGTSHLWIALSRLGITYTQSTFFILSVIFFLLKAFKKNKKIYFVISGGLFGLGMYSNYAVRIIPILILALFVNYIFKKNIKEKLLNLTYFLITSFIIFLPQGIFYLQNPDAFSSRQKSIYIFSDIGRKWTNYNMSDPEILLEQTKRTFNIFVGDNSTQYNYHNQLLDYGSIFFFLLGIAYGLKKITEFKYQFMFLWILLAIIGQVLTTIPPPIFLPRFVIGLPPLYFFIALGVVLTLKILRKLKINKKIAKAIIICILILISYFNIYAYFISYPKQVAGDLNARAATKIAYLLNKDYESYTAYFYTQPRLYSDFGTLRFLSPNINKINLRTAQDLNLVPFNRSKNKSVYIIYSDYGPLVANLSSASPKSTIKEIRDIDGNVQFYVYTP